MPGKSLSNEGSKHSLRLWRVKQLRTIAPYHLQANGQTERMNFTICAMLKTLSEKLKHSWKYYIHKFTNAYSCTSRNTTVAIITFHLVINKYSLPTDFLLGDHTTEHSKDPQTVHNQISQGNERSLQVSSARAQKSKNQKQLTQTDKVLTWSLFERGTTRKLNSYWEAEVRGSFESEGMKI